jgi:hypothetical protein
MRAKALTWPVVVADVCWGTFVAAVASTLGLLIANFDRAEDPVRHCKEHSGEAIRTFLQLWIASLRSQ